MIAALPVSSGLAARLTGSPLAIFLDIDGTLAPIAPRPDAARVPPETLVVVADLTHMRDVHVAVVTGRSVVDARRLVPLDHVGVIGNHGFEILGDDGTMIITPAAHAFRDALTAASARLMELERRYPGVVVEDKTWTISAHYRLAPRDVVPEVVRQVRAIAAAFGLQTTSGKEVLELRPPIQVNKGTAVVELARRLDALDSDAASIYIGDDRTDEDAFVALRAEARHAVTVRVGRPSAGEESGAEFYVDSPAAALQFLIELAALRKPKVSS
jgi:trehalose-phosphatase